MYVLPNGLYTLTFSKNQHNIYHTIINRKGEQHEIIHNRWTEEDFMVK